MAKEFSLHQERSRRKDERELYPSLFMTGSDVVVKFGADVLAQVNSINCAITENVQPIYGVWDQKYAVLARGTRMVQGVFTINFISPNYIIEKLLARNLGTTQKPLSGDNVSTESALNITTKEGKENFIHHIEQLLNAGNFDAVERFAENQARLIHGAQTEPDPTETSVFYNKHGSPGLSQITIEYFSQKGSMQKVIDGVAIVSCAQLVDMSGRTVMEEYQFIGRDMKFNN